MQLSDESRFHIGLKFFNGSNEEFIVDRVTGLINIDNMPNISLPTLQLDEKHLPPKIAP